MCIKDGGAQRLSGFASIAEARVSHRRDIKTGELHMAKQRRTSGKAAKAASKVLRDGRTGKTSKTAAGSALSQAAPKKTPKKKKT